MKQIGLLALLLIAPAIAQAQSDRSAYAGQESRAVKSLSEADIQAYLDGAGMGLAKSAELSGYPGPLHVLELAPRLGLTEGQEEETQRIFERMRGEAIRLGKSILEKESELDRLFSLGTVTPESLAAAVAEIARLQGKLRETHLRAHLEMKTVLTPAQVRLYDQLRGYHTRDH